MVCSHNPALRFKAAGAGGVALVESSFLFRIYVQTDTAASQRIAKEVHTIWTPTQDRGVSLAT